MNETAYLQREAKKIKEMYPVGTRVELIKLEDPYSPVEAGARGTIEHVDALGQLHMKWDNGRTLAFPRKISPRHEFCRRGCRPGIPCTFPQADLIKNQALSQAKGLYTPQILGERIDMAAYFFF